jgi:hypothetical protein
LKLMYVVAKQKEHIQYITDVNKENQSFKSVIQVLHAINYVNASFAISSFQECTTTLAVFLRVQVR